MNELMTGADLLNSINSKLQFWLTATERRGLRLLIAKFTRNIETRVILYFPSNASEVKEVAE